MDLFDSRKDAPDVVSPYAAYPEVSACFDRCAQVIFKTRFPGYGLTVHRTPDTVSVSVQYVEADVDGADNMVQVGRRWVIENDWTEAQIVQTLFKAILTSLEHRAREHFTYKDRAILCPHNTIEQLCAMGQERSQRGEPIQFT